jgi:hypothetical protein
MIEIKTSGTKKKKQLSLCNRSKIEVDWLTSSRLPLIVFTQGSCSARQFDRGGDDDDDDDDV